MGTLRLDCLSTKEATDRNGYAMTSARGHPDGQASLCPSYGLVAQGVKGLLLKRSRNFLRALFISLREAVVWHTSACVETSGIAES